MKTHYILPVLLLTYSLAYGQNLDDAVRFSRNIPAGTARSAAMGGAFGALGGDLSTLNTNPAGLGVFRKSEVAFSPMISFNNINSGHGNTDKNTFQIGDFGAVFSFYNSHFDWRGFNFGINYTNLNNFNRKYDQAVGDSYNSITNVWAFDAYGSAPDNIPYLGSAMAYDTKLIYLFDENPYDYYSVLEMENPETGEIETMPVGQQKLTKESGYQGEYALSFGTNYKDKLYIGFSLGLQSLYYKMKSAYIEAPEEQSPTGLDLFSYDENIRINGVGTNLKFGVIYRPIPEVRVGAAIQTPTWYNLTYDYSTALAAWYLFEEPEIGRDQPEYYTDSYYSEDFNMRTPWRATLSIATVLRQKAILSLDYEYIDYANAKYSNNSYNRSYAGENQDIKDLLRGTHNVRVGAEYRFNSLFSLRAGYGYLASPYEYDKNNHQVQSFSAGFGLNFGVFYCDAAYMHRYTKNNTVFYSGVNPFTDEYFTSIPVQNKYNTNEARLTLGVRF